MSSSSLPISLRLISVNISIASVLLVIAIVLIPYVQYSYVDGAPRTISSSMLKTAKGSLTMGAGYSLTTNAFYSSCLDFNDDTIASPPSYNFECKLFEFELYEICFSTCTWTWTLDLCTVAVFMQISAYWALGIWAFGIWGFGDCFCSCSDSRRLLIPMTISMAIENMEILYFSYI